MSLHLPWPEVTAGVQGWWSSGKVEYEMSEGKDVLEAMKSQDKLFPISIFLNTLNLNDAGKQQKKPVLFAGAQGSNY